MPQHPANSSATRYSTQRSGVAPPHPEGDLWSGAASNSRLSGVASLPASFAQGCCLTRAMNPSGQCRQHQRDDPRYLPAGLTPLSNVKADPGIIECERNCLAGKEESVGHACGAPRGCSTTVGPYCQLQTEDIATEPGASIGKCSGPFEVPVYWPDEELQHSI